MASVKLELKDLHLQCFSRRIAARLQPCVSVGTGAPWRAWDDAEDAYPHYKLHVGYLRLPKHLPSVLFYKVRIQVRHCDAMQVQIINYMYDAVLLCSLYESGQDLNLFPLTYDLRVLKMMTVLLHRHR